MSTQHYLQLAMTEGLGPITLRRLLQAAGSAEAACRAPLPLLRSLEGIGRSRADAICSGLKAACEEAKRQIEQAAQMGVAVIGLEDRGYPPMLRSIHDPPPVLFVRGGLEDRDLNALAIVGSRRCSFYGREQADRFASSLAGIGFTVVSGGARGTDSAAHQGALKHPAGRTIAVLGCGVDVVYPPENGALFDQITTRGAVISEYPLGTPPLAENFPRRNRIVSGISRGVLVVEADLRSGALITAHQACEQGRCVFAIPGRIDNKLSGGPHQLIREGATLVGSIQEIVEGLSPLPADVQAPTLFDLEMEPGEVSSPAAAEIKPAAPVTQQQQQILSAMEAKASNVDELIDRTQLPAHIILQELTMLSLKGLIKRTDGQTYRRN